MARMGQAREGNTTTYDLKEKIMMIIQKNNKLTDVEAPFMLAFDT